MKHLTNEDWAWLLLDDDTFVSEMTDDSDLLSECSTVVTIGDDACGRWGGNVPAAMDSPPPTVKRRALELALSPSSSSSSSSSSPSSSDHSGTGTISTGESSSNKGDQAPTKPERKGSNHDRSRRRARISRNSTSSHQTRNSTSSHTTYHTMETIAEGGEESDKSDKSANSPQGENNKRKFVISSKKVREAVSEAYRDLTMKNLMKDFYDSFTLSNGMSDGSDTDESVTGNDSKKEEKRKIKMVIKAEAGECLMRSRASTRSAESMDNNGPTNEMMAIVEKLSVRAALVLTSDAKHRANLVGQEPPHVDHQGFPSLEPTQQPEGASTAYEVASLDSSSWKSHDWSTEQHDWSTKQHCLKVRQDDEATQDGAAQNVAAQDFAAQDAVAQDDRADRLPSLEESSSSSSSFVHPTSDDECSEGSGSKKGSTIGRVLEITGRRRRGGSGRTTLSSPSSPLTQNDSQHSAKLTSLTPQMKLLIEKLSVKAALSVISQAESSLIQDAVMDLSLCSSSKH